MRFNVVTFLIPRIANVRLSPLVKEYYYENRSTLTKLWAEIQYAVFFVRRGRYVINYRVSRRMRSCWSAV